VEPACNETARDWIFSVAGMFLLKQVYSPGCEGFPLKTGFPSIQVPFKTGFTIYVNINQDFKRGCIDNGHRVQVNRKICELA
jgi:hypothetical protein